MSRPFRSKFFTLLSTFDESELRDFQQWLESPWCNTNKNLPRLLEALRSFHPHFESKHLTREKLFYRVLPNGKYSNRRLNNLMSEAFKAGKRYLPFRRFAQDSHGQQQFWVEALQHRHLDDWFVADVEAELQALEAEEVMSWDDHMLLFRLHKRLYHHTTRSPRMEPGHPTIVKMGEQLDLLYLLERAVVITEKRSRKQFFHKEAHTVTQDIEKWLAVSERVDHPAVTLFRMRFSYSDVLGLQEYESLQKAYMAYFDQLNEREQKLHLLYLLNDTMRLIKKGGLDITATLPLYKIGLQAKLLLHDGQLTRNTYATIVVASNTKRDFDYTYQFIATYTKYVEEVIQQDCQRWAKAHTAYWSGQLDRCVALLVEREFDTVYFQFISRVVRTQAYFDLYLQDESYHDYLFSHLDSYERLLRRNKRYSESFKSAFLAFVRKCRQLARYYESPDTERTQIEQLLDDIENIQALNWLKKKQGELLKQRQVK